LKLLIISYVTIYHFFFFLIPSQLSSFRHTFLHPLFVAAQSPSPNSQTNASLKAHSFVPYPKAYMSSDPSNYRSHSQATERNFRALLRGLNAYRYMPGFTFESVKHFGYLGWDGEIAYFLLMKLQGPRLNGLSALRLSGSRKMSGKR
jgi:hypothetical protein